MRTPWPDSDGTIRNHYIHQLHLRSVMAQRVYHSVLRRFESFVLSHSPNMPLSQETLTAWLRDRASTWPKHMVMHRARIIDNFLNWLVAEGLVSSNPFKELGRAYGLRNMTTIVSALLQPDPKVALEALKPAERFASHLGPLMENHLIHMRALGFRCGYEGDLLRFDRFLQRRIDADKQPIAQLVREWSDLARSPVAKVRCLQMGRVISRAVKRIQGLDTTIAIDRLLLREAQRQQRRPYIYTVEQIHHLLETARNFPSPRAPLRPATLYTMLILSYCAGLRLGEIVRLQVGNLNLEEGTLDISQTKFFKSRRLPLTVSVISILRDYLMARQRAGAPSDPKSPLFWQETDGKGYAYPTVEALLTKVIRLAGLKPATGRVGPRTHDLRHSFVVHRMLTWYQEGINPQSQLPYLVTYLGHRDINSTLVYLTITQELLQQANERFRTWGANVLDVTQQGGTS